MNHAAELQRRKTVHIPTYSKETGLTYKQITDIVCTHFPNAVMVDNLLCLNPPNLEWHVEVCDTKYRRGTTILASEAKAYHERNNKTDQHVGVYAHDHKWKEENKKSKHLVKSGVVRAESVWLELDRKADGGFHKAMKDAYNLYLDFPYPDQMRLWTSGNESVHIEINGQLFGTPTGAPNVLCGRGKNIYNLAHLLAGDIRHSNGLVDVWNEHDTELLKKLHREAFPDMDASKVKQNLENIDPNIYGAHSLIRAPWSIHEKSGRQKNLLAGVLEFPDTKPYMLDMYIKATEHRIVRPKKIAVPASADYILAEFMDSIPDLDPEEADEDGWVRKLRNPMYDDHNPSLSVNITTGLFWDFGDPDWQMDFPRFIMAKYNETHEQATKRILNATGKNI